LCRERKVDGMGGLYIHREWEKDYEFPRTLGNGGKQLVVKVWTISDKRIQR
jgi:hypothetical protein